MEGIHLGLHSTNEPDCASNSIIFCHRKMYSLMEWDLGLMNTSPAQYKYRKEEFVIVFFLKYYQPFCYDHTMNFAPIFSLHELFNVEHSYRFGDVLLYRSRLMEN
eukprot:TRINITY_DN766_c1_g1_i1.p1 TRINITY_DN766_c1_g1~~TRINITY_DN766_c1_g1_i1.p1  ORF type:complete len:105 (-),score=10.19 TRINITY_DN766_c1_g1_i1:48-362(-)